MIWANFTVTVSFLGSFSPPLPAFCVAIRKTAVQSLARRELLGGKIKLWWLLALLCYWDPRLGAGGNAWMPSGSSFRDCLQRRMWISLHCVPRVCMSWQPAITFGDAVVCLFCDTNCLQFLPNALFLILCAQTVESKVRYFLLPNIWRLMEVTSACCSMQQWLRSAGE